MLSFAYDPVVMPSRSAVKKVDSAGGEVDARNSDNSASSSKAKKVPLTLVVDNTNAKIDLTHYLAMGVWLGWPFFYLCLMWTFPLLWWYAKPLLFTILAMLAVSAFTTVDSRKQPKVRFELRSGLYFFMLTVYYCLSFMQWAMQIGAEIMK